MQKASKSGQWQKMQTACVADRNWRYLKSLSMGGLGQPEFWKITMAYRNVLFGFYEGRQQYSDSPAGRQESFLIPFGSLNGAGK